MATIEAIERLVEDKSKALTKAVKAIEKQEKIVQGVEKTLKALKSSKAAKDAIKKAETELSTEQKKLENLQESQTASQEKIAELNQRLRGVKEFVKSRTDFLTWWEKEEPKMADLTDKAREAADDAEAASKKAEVAAGKGEIENATKEAQAAQKAAVAAKAAETKAESLYRNWGSTFDVQRNYKTSDLPAEDVKSYAETTKKVYESFKQADKLKAVVVNLTDAAEKSAETADEAAKSGGDLSRVHRKVLATVKQGMEKIAETNRTRTTSKVGNYINNEGELFTRLLGQYQGNKAGMEAVVRKAVEQAEPLMAGIMASFDKTLTTLDQMQQKALARVPREQHGALRSEIAELTGILTNERRYKVVYDRKYETTLVEFNKLKDALG